MKKMLFSLVVATSSLFATPQAVVFDWGNVIAFDDRSVVVDFMCETFQISAAEFEKANFEKRKAVQVGKSEIDFWVEWARKKGIELPDDWPSTYTAALKKSVGADPKMLELIDILKQNQIRVGLLSNINSRYTQMIRDFGFYKPFDPCLLSCEMGLEKPDQRVYDLLLKTLGISGKDVVFIDDKLENVDSAKKKGIDAILFESEEQVRRELSKRGLLP